MAGAPHPKPVRVRLSRHELDKLRARAFDQFDGRCACGCGRFAESIHHLLAGSWKEDVLDAVVPVAGDGTRLCHGALTSGNVTDGIDPLEVRKGIRARLDARFPEKIRWLVSKVGPDSTSRLYPQDKVCAVLDCWEVVPCPDHEKEVQRCEDSSSSPASPRPAPSLPSVPRGIEPTHL